MKLQAALLVILTSTLLRPQDPTASAFARAALQIRRLPPSSFPFYPAPVRRQLEERGCQIPQVSLAYDPQASSNVVRGAFFSGVNEDWAALCSHRGFSSILVFRHGAESHPSELGRTSGGRSLEGLGGDVIGYVRGITRIRRSQLAKSRIESAGKNQWPLIRHDAIDDAFSDKTLTTFYFHNGTWQKIDNGSYE